MVSFLRWFFSRHHGSVEPFWIWVTDDSNEHIYHSENFLLPHDRVRETHKLVFTVPLFEPLPDQFHVLALSEHWLGESINIIDSNMICL